MENSLTASTQAPLLAIGLGFVISWLLSKLVVAGGPIDAPRERGSHDAPTTTSGGLAIMAATGLGLFLCLKLFPQLKAGDIKDSLILLGFSASMGLIGAVDDVFDLSPKFRLGLQIMLCAAVGWAFRIEQIDFGLGLVWSLQPLMGAVGATLWLLLGINAINFMDGSNGLAVGAQSLWQSLVVVGLTILAPASLPFLPVAAVVLLYAANLGANLGFLPTNVTGRAFQGDAGSLFSGGLITASVLLLTKHDLSAPWLGGFLLAPFLVDVLLTLWVRYKAKKPLMSAHREHLYQLWLQKRDHNHLNLALRVWGLILASLLIATVLRVIYEAFALDLRFFVMCAWLTYLSLRWYQIRKKLN